LCNRRLRSPRGGLRPTSDRVREAIFNRIGGLEGARVLDLYAGTGALGIEAASRGAASLVFVERAPRCLSVLRANLATLGLKGSARVVAGDVPRAVRRLGGAGDRFDLVLVDPPYGSDEIRRACEALVASGVLARGARVVVERGRRHPLPVVEGLAAVDERRYGDTVVAQLSAEVRESR
jgi:16S rRNA (guanine966-N2)-methyltransferase